MNTNLTQMISRIPVAGQQQSGRRGLRISPLVCYIAQRAVHQPLPQRRRLPLELFKRGSKIPFPRADLEQVADVGDAADRARPGIEPVFFVEFGRVWGSGWDGRGSRDCEA